MLSLGKKREGSHEVQWWVVPRQLCGGRQRGRRGGAPTPLFCEVWLDPCVSLLQLLCAWPWTSEIMVGSHWQLSTTTRLKFRAVGCHTPHTRLRCLARRGDDIPYHSKLFADLCSAEFNICIAELPRPYRLSSPLGLQLGTDNRHGVL